MYIGCVARKGQHRWQWKICMKEETRMEHHRHASSQINRSLRGSRLVCLLGACGEWPRQYLHLPSWHSYVHVTSTTALPVYY